MKSLSILENFEWWPTFRRYAQFCIVGTSGLAVDMTIIWLLADPKMLHWNLTLSKVIAAEVALINNFVWNELWTFRELTVARKRWSQRAARLFRFNLICVVGIGLSVLLLNLQVYLLHMNVYLANFLSIVAVSVWNFLMNLKFGWKRGVERDQGSRRRTEDSPPDLEVQPEEKSGAATAARRS